MAQVGMTFIVICIGSFVVSCNLLMELELVGG
ncbi:hypothetical protein I3843_12G000400 [Carya illinoinensis]|nr:hypothetical protein I3843_12G000400 [Carya illinoinensis]